MTASGQGTLLPHYRPPGPLGQPGPPGPPGQPGPPGPNKSFLSAVHTMLTASGARLVKVYNIPCSPPPTLTGLELRSSKPSPLSSTIAFIQRSDWTLTSPEAESTVATNQMSTEPISACEVLTSRPAAREANSSKIYFFHFLTFHVLFPRVVNIMSLQCSRVTIVAKHVMAGFSAQRKATRRRRSSGA